MKRKIFRSIDDLIAFTMNTEPIIRDTPWFSLRIYCQRQRLPARALPGAPRNQTAATMPTVAIYTMGALVDAI